MYIIKKKKKIRKQIKYTRMNKHNNFLQQQFNTTQQDALEIYN